MDTTSLSIRIIFYAAFFSLIILSIIFFSYYFDRRTRIVFCDVGQGDGTYIRIKNRIDVIIDAGPDNSILSCLGQYMPFFDRTIELVFITHPQKDHYFGFIEIGRRYQIANMFMNPLNSNNNSFQTLLKILTLNNAEIYFPHQGTKIEAEGDIINFLWPSEKYLSDNISGHRSTFHLINQLIDNNTSIKHSLGNSSLDPNEFSLIFSLKEGPINMLFTGDAEQSTLNNLQENTDIKTTILKVPHHGSKNGLNIEFLQLADPTISVISAGKKTRYNHPSQEIKEMYQNLHKTYVITYQEGSIVFVIKGNTLERKK